MYCPNCKKSYSAEITICPDCNINLIDLSEDNVKEDTADIQPVKLESVSNEVDTAIIMDLLQSNDIPCYKKSNGSGGYMNIYMGYSIYGEDIYVAQKDYQKAKELLSTLAPTEEAADPDEVKDEYPVPFLRRPQIIARIIIAAGLTLVILIFILEKLLFSVK